MCKENEKFVESFEVRKVKSKRIVSKFVVVGIDYEDVIVNYERKWYSDIYVFVKNVVEIKVVKLWLRFISNGYVFSLYEKFFLYFGWYNYGLRDYVLYRYSEYVYDCSKYVWFCRDDEIYKFIV